MTPYRQSAKSDTEPKAPVSDSLTRIDVSGRAGYNGAPGRNGADGYGSGADGLAGDHAGPAGQGQDAGLIEARLKPDPDNSAYAIVSSKCLGPDGEERNLDERIAIGDMGFVDLLARGGRGGHGAKGGHGGDGARGSAGRDATRYSSGGNGGPGGDGGRGGNGSSGAPGGQGGRIIVEVAHEDTHLLMLTRHVIHGGKGGNPGVNGAGGEGGPGGPGGSSYSWTESESYTDANGQRQTRSTYHSNPGGSTGSPGRNGAPGNAILYSGKNGSLGTFGIQVKQGRQTHSYASRYDLRLVGFQHRCDNEDGIYEPEEKVHVFGIEVENIGGMPTPATREIHLELREKGWVFPENAHLVLPPSLGPGQRHRFDSEELICTLGAYHPSKPSDPLTAEEIIHHRALVPEVSREFSNYESDQSLELGRFTLRFPLMVSPIETLHSLSPGQAARLRFRITNISKRAFGLRSELGRSIRFRLFLHESELGDEHFMFFDDQGTQIPLSQGFGRDIPELGPGQSLDVEGTLAFGEDAPFYRAGRIWLSLELGAIDKPLEPKPIQYRDFDVRVGRPFAWDSPKDVLLLVHNRTEAEELSAWEKLLSSLGLSTSVLDLSLEGGVDLEAQGSQAERSLGEDLWGRTLVVLNQAMDTSKGERLPTHFLLKEQVLELGAAGAHLLIAGEKTPDMRRLLVPTLEGGEPSQTEAEYLKARRAKPSKGPEIGHEAQRVELLKWSWLWWGKPSEKAIQKRALRLMGELQRAHPHERHILVWELKPNMLKNYGFFKRWSMGEVQIYRTLNGAQAPITMVRVPDAKLHRAEHVLGHENAMHLLLSLPFKEKLRRLDHLTRPRPETESAQSPTEPGLQTETLATLASDAILVDLCYEQLGILHRPWCAGASPRSIKAGLPLLRQMVEHLFDPEEDLSPARISQIIRLISRLHFFSLSQVSAWEYIPPFLFERRAPVLRSVTLDLLKEWLERLFKGPERRGPMEKVRAELKAALKKLGEQWKQAKKKQEFQGPRSAFARNMLLWPVEPKEVSTSSKALMQAQERILEKQAHKEFCERDRKSADRRQTMMERAAGARKTLLRPERCAELCARAQREARVLEPPKAEEQALAYEAAAEEEAEWVNDLPREKLM